MNKIKYYITTTAPYVNSDPHIGFALEIIQADVVARYNRLKGQEVCFNTGTDEHGLKIYREALKAKKEPQDYVDEYAAKFDRLKKILNLSYNYSIRTTDPKHVKAAQEFWKRCDKSGDIYKKHYKVKYCVGCELEKTDSELDKGKCPVHPNLKIETIEEENYFFKFSKYQDKLLKLYENEEFVVPNYRLKEIRNFVSEGLEDFSISRLKEKMPWGIEVPGDPKHVMYVWFDALIFYISSVGWPEKTDFQGFWPGVQVAGKDNLRQQSAIWQAMLFSADLPNSTQILIHGFIQSGGQKMSKSLGNVIDPIKLSKKYGVDGLRYYLLSKIHPFNDSDFTIEGFEKTYNADLANGLGNLASRIITMAEKFTEGVVPEVNKKPEDHPLQVFERQVWKDLDKYIQNYEFHKAINSVWGLIHKIDKYIDKNKPWELAKANKKEEINWVVFGLLDALKDLAWLIYPFLPEAANKIIAALNLKTITNKSVYKDSFESVKVGVRVKKIKPLFPRLQ